ncbi:MAG: tetratricopeptide repeat protein [Gemmatimonadota bacterium]
MLLLIAFLRPPGWFVMAAVVLFFVPGRWWRWRTREFRRGLKLIQAGKLDQAREKLEAFLADIRRDESFARVQPYFNLGRPYPYEAAAESNLGVARLVGGEPRRALTHFKAALDSAPDWFQARFGEASALRLSGDLPGAETAVRAALDTRDKYVPARLLLALILRERGGDDREAEAERVLEPVREAGKDPEELIVRMRGQWPTDSAV